MSDARDGAARWRDAALRFAYLPVERREDLIATWRQDARNIREMEAAPGQTKTRLADDIDLACDVLEQIGEASPGQTG